MRLKWAFNASVRFHASHNLLGVVLFNVTCHCDSKINLPDSLPRTCSALQLWTERAGYKSIKMNVNQRGDNVKFVRICMSLVPREMLKCKQRVTQFVFNLLSVM
jgi:hypothetical protein